METQSAKRLPAFSLPELLVVLVIIGILVLIALPNLMPVEELGFEQQPLVTDGGHANDRIEIIEASEKGFRATATAVVDFDGDGEYNVWEIDQDKNLRETVKD